MDINEENEGTVAVLVDYITSTSNATVDLVKSGADILEKLVDDAKNLSKVCKHQIKRTIIIIFYYGHRDQRRCFKVRNVTLQLLL